MTVLCWLQLYFRHGNNWKKQKNTWETWDQVKISILIFTRKTNCPNSRTVILLSHSVVQVLQIELIWLYQTKPLVSKEGCWFMPLYFLTSDAHSELCQTFKIEHFSKFLGQFPPGQLPLGQFVGELPPRTIAPRQLLPPPPLNSFHIGL